MYLATPCPCGHRACKDWHVTGLANVQGVGFTRQQAEITARLCTMVNLAMQLPPEDVDVIPPSDPERWTAFLAECDKDIAELRERVERHKQQPAPYGAHGEPQRTTWRG